MPYVQAIQRALALFEMGRTDEAEHLCRGVLESRPRDFNALHILGVLRTRASVTRTRSGCSGWRLMPIQRHMKHSSAAGTR